MKKVFSFIFILTLLLTGCTDEGFLQISNHTSGDVWCQVNNDSTKWLLPGESNSYDWNIKTSLLGNEEKIVAVTYGGELLWNESYEVRRIIKPGKTSNLEITGDIGELIITSISNEDVWYQLNSASTSWLQSGESNSYVWNLSTIPFKEVSVIYGGGYWFWYDIYEINTTILPEQVYNIEIIGDLGEINIVNETSNTNILSIYISPSSSSDWGENLLGSVIFYPGYNNSWQVTIGYWDIMFVDEEGWEYTFMNQLINPETINTYLFVDDLMRSSNPIGEKTANSQRYSDKIEGKCRKK
jgi:hypothetical protein